MPVDKDGYDEHMRRRAWDVAASVAVIVMSFGVAMFVTGGGYNSTTVSAGDIVVHLGRDRARPVLFSFRRIAAMRHSQGAPGGRGLLHAGGGSAPSEDAGRRRRCRAARLGHVHARHAPIDSDVLVRAVGAVRLLRRRSRLCSSTPSRWVHTASTLSFYNASISRSNPSFEGVVLTPDLVAQLVFGLNVGAAVGRPRIRRIRSQLWATAHNCVLLRFPLANAWGRGILLQFLNTHACATRSASGQLKKAADLGDDRKQRTNEWRES